jgi:hypothetical protein
MNGHGIQYFGAAARHSFNHANRRAFPLAPTINGAEMDQQCQYFGPDIDELTCGCSASTYLSRVFGQFIPCCALLHLGVPKGRMTGLLVVFQEDNSNAFCLEL